MLAHGAGLCYIEGAFHAFYKEALGLTKLSARERARIGLLALIIAAAVILFTRLRWNEKSYLLVISCESGALASVEALLAACKTSLRGKVCAGGRVELTVELKSACGADLPERIGALPGVESASLVSYNGDYAA